MPRQPLSARQKALALARATDAPRVGPLFWEALPSGALIRDAPEWRAYTGQPEPLPTTGWLDSVTHPRDRAVAMLAWAEAVQSGQPLSFTHRMRGADGRYRLFLTQAMPVRDAAGNVTQWRGVSVDLTEREREEDRQSFQAQTFAANRDAILLTDLAGRIIDWNPAAERLLGYRRDEAVGQAAATFLQHAADRAGVPESLPADGSWQGEIAYARKDGATGLGEIDLRPLLDAQEQVVGMIHTIRDVTGRTASEAQLEALLGQERATRRELEAALALARTAETKFHTLIDRNIIGVFIADANHVIEANDAFLRMFGYDQADVEGRRIRWAEMTPPRWALEDARASQELITQGACTPYEKEYLRKDRTPVPIILAGVLLEWQPLQIMGFVLDITDRKRLEHEVAARAGELEAVFEAMADSIFVYDAQGVLQRTNAAARALNPHTVEAEYLHERFGDRITPFAVRDLAGRPIAADAAPVTRILRGERVVSEDNQMTLGARDILLNTSGAPIRDEQGLVTGAVIVSRDMTEVRALERRTHEALEALLVMAETLVQAPETEATPQEDWREALHPAARRLVALVSNILGGARVALYAGEPDGGAVFPLAVAGLPFDQEARWQAANPEGFALSLLLDEARLQEAQAGHSILLDIHDPHLRGAPNPHGVGTMLIVPLLAGQDLTGALVLDYGGRDHLYSPEELRLAGAAAKLAALLVDRDRLLREREAARSEALALVEAQRRMDTFLGIASHELRTPLTSIKANLQITDRAIERFAAGQGTLDARLGRAHDLLGRTDRHVARLDRIVEDMLDMARIQAGTLQFALETGDLAAVAREAALEQQALWPEREIALDLPEEPVRVWMDAGRIEQVITNYLTNALKYSPPETGVRVRLRVAEGWARVEVTDQGPGIDPAQQERIWDRFYRTPGAEVLSGSGVGLGLGLFLCQTIIAQHGGSVGVVSAPGAGAMFWFALRVG